MVFFCKAVSIVPTLVLPAALVTVLFPVIENTSSIKTSGVEVPAVCTIFCVPECYQKLLLTILVILPFTQVLFQLFWVAVLVLVHVMVPSFLYIPTV
jgi:hypothetical protein